MSEFLRPVRRWRKSAAQPHHIQEHGSHHAAMLHRFNTAELLPPEPPQDDWERRQLEHALPEYQVVREIGRGAMGVVFLARDVVLHRLVAIKVLRHELSRDDEHHARFLTEARLTARLNHPNIVSIHQFGRIGELSYTVMKFVDGTSLAERLAAAGKLPPNDAARILRDLARAVDYAHGEGVIHRDLKPDNVILESGTGRPMLTDFGVAALRWSDRRRADAMRAFGTPQYMSPEQAMGELHADERSDIYSLGVIGYRMIAGRLPFDGANFVTIAAGHVGKAAMPLRRLAPDMPAALAAAIGKCLCKDPDRRWRSAAQLADALEQGTSHRSRWLFRLASSFIF